MKTILVPTDFSKNAENALHYAINLAKKTDAKIILLHSFHIDYTNAYVPEDIIQKELEEAKTKSNAHLKALYHKVSHGSKHPIECISSENFAVDEILSLVEEKNIDLIIMGTRGANGQLGRELFGTNSSKVVEKATCPVITVPEESTRNNIKSIVYATEYLDSDIICLQSLVDLANLLEAKIQVVHVSLYQNNIDEEKERMKLFEAKVCENINCQNISFKLLFGTNIEQRLEGYLEEEKEVDLLVASAHHRNLLDKLLGQSVSKMLSLYVKTSLMVFHHKRNVTDDVTDTAVRKLIL